MTRERSPVLVSYIFKKNLNNIFMNIFTVDAAKYYFSKKLQFIAYPPKIQNSSQVQINFTLNAISVLKK